MQRLEIIRDAILSVSDNVGHYEELKKEPPYFVWAEDGETGMKSDNRRGEHTSTGTIDLYTQQENDPLVEAMCLALDECGCAWELYSIQREEATKLIHYEWVWEV